MVGGVETALYAGGGGRSSDSEVGDMTFVGGGGRTATPPCPVSQVLVAELTLPVALKEKKLSSSQTVSTNST